MNTLFDLIDQYDIPGLNQYLHMKSVQDIDKPNTDGIYPIEYVVSRFDPLSHNIKTHCVLIQILLNKGCEMNKELLTDVKMETIDPKIKELIECVLEMKSNRKKDRFSRHENLFTSTKKIQQFQRNNFIPVPKSDYSDTELMQLEQIAQKHSIRTKPVNHLALRIINHLESELEKLGYYN